MRQVDVVTTRYLIRLFICSASERARSHYSKRRATANWFVTIHLWLSAHAYWTTIRRFWLPGGVCGPRPANSLVVQPFPDTGAADGRYQLSAISYQPGFGFGVIRRFRTLFRFGVLHFANLVAFYCG